MTELSTRIHGYAEGVASRIKTRQARVAVIGVGQVGSSAAQALRRGGFPVVGIDVDRDRFRAEGGHAPSPRGTDDFRCLAHSDVSLICVPTPLNTAREPELGFVRRAARSIADHLHYCQLVVVESTSYPGTTDEVVRPILERTGLRCGRDFFLASCPERLDPANKTFDVPDIPRVVGGADAPSGELAGLFYRQFVPSVTVVSSARAAEAAKMLENAYRFVNIALVNELKIAYAEMGVDVWEVIAAAATKPFGYQPFWPGPGVGGHCVPVDPVYLQWKAQRCGLRLHTIEAAGQVDRSVRAFALMRIEHALRSRAKALCGARVLILGVAYKPGVADTRESPAGGLIRRLVDAGAEVAYNDPLVPAYPSPGGSGQSLTSQPLTAQLLEQQDCVVVMTEHREYDFTWIVRHSALVVDTRNATRQVREHRERIVKA